MVRARTDPATWDPDRPAEDLPSLGGTIYLTVLGLVALVALAWLEIVVAVVLYGVLLVWSIGVDVSGRRLTTRVRSPGHRVVWTLLRPAFAVGTVLHGVIELVASLFG